MNPDTHADVHGELVTRASTQPKLFPLYLGLFFGLASMASERVLSADEGQERIPSINEIDVSQVPTRNGAPDFKRLGYSLAIHCSAIEHAMLHRADNLKRRQGYVEKFGKVVEVVGGTFAWTGGAAVAISGTLKELGKLLFSTEPLDADKLGQAIADVESTVAFYIERTGPQIASQMQTTVDIGNELARNYSSTFTDAFTRARKGLVHESNLLRKAAGAKLPER